MEIRTGSSDSNSSRHKSSSLESVQWKSNESQYDRNKGSGVKRELEEKGIRKIRVRDTQRGRTEETVMPSTSRYNLRPRNGTRVWSRPTIERNTPQGGPVRARNSRGQHDSPYIEEQTRPGNKNTRRRGSQQQNGQERKGGANTSRSISLEFLVGQANYKS
ncbi:uncharacterized protein TNCV_227431 [Trichonephila clavipes]|nr:uncharacterized protein TNCV_227431 [Trichonephila clavipes]